MLHLGMEHSKANAEKNQQAREIRKKHLLKADTP